MIRFSKILISFLERADKRFFVNLLLLMVVTAFIELVSIGSLFPYIKILGDPKIIHQNYWLHNFYEFFHFKTINQYLIFIGVVIFIMILIKGCLSMLNNYYQSKFTSQLNNRLSKFCLHSFLRMSYSEYINVNSSILSKHLLVDIAGIASIFSALLTLLTDVIIACALIGLMIWIDPLLVGMVVAILAGFLWLLIRTTRDRIRNLARANEFCNRQVYKTAAESLAGLKDIKIYNVEDYFMQRFLKWQYEVSAHVVEFSVISNIPGIAMNVMGFGVVLMILIYLIISKGNLLTILPTIGIIGLCVQRLLPSASRMSASISMIRRFAPLAFVVRNVLNVLLQINKKINAVENKDSSITFGVELLLKNIYYQYPNTSKYALNNVSLKIKKNTSVGIVGESGAGKSTLVDVLLGLLPIQSGEIWCDASNITQFEHVALSRLVGYVPQQTFLFDGTIQQNIAFGIPENKIDHQLLNRCIQVAQLKKLIDELPEGLHTQIGENGIKLSGGQRQRLGIARALYHDPEILIMDEATNALDSATEKEFNEALQGLMKEKTIIIIAHRLSSIQICDEIIQLEKGQIVAQGSYQELLRTSDKFRQVYNISTLDIVE